MSKVIYVSQVSDMPKVSHWAIITYESQHIPGDERSQTHPGHGYGPSTNYYVSYKAYLDEETWKAAVIEHQTPKFGAPRSFTAMFVNLAKITTTVNVDIAV